MKLAYIAGPFRADTAWGIEKNVRRAEELAHRVWLGGVAALCPHTNTRFFHGEGPDLLWLDGTLEMLRRCDLVVLTAGWRESTGSVSEVAEAQDLGLPVFDTANHAGERLLQEYLDKYGVVA